jgi:hypothetical protein
MLLRGKPSSVDGHPPGLGACHGTTLVMPVPNESESRPAWRSAPAIRHKRASGACRFLANSLVEAVVSARSRSRSHRHADHRQRDQTSAASIAHPGVRRLGASRLLRLSRVLRPRYAFATKALVRRGRARTSAKATEQWRDLGSAAASCVIAFARRASRPMCAKAHGERSRKHFFARDRRTSVVVARRELVRDAGASCLARRPVFVSAEASFARPHGRAGLGERARMHLERGFVRDWHLRVPRGTPLAIAFV